MHVLLCGPSLTLELGVHLHSTGLTPVTTLFSSWLLGSFSCCGIFHLVCL